MDRSQYIEEIQPLLIEDPTDVVNWMKNKRLLRNDMNCSECNRLMTWTKKECHLKSCFSHKTRHHRGHSPQKPLWVLGH